MASGGLSDFFSNIKALPWNVRDAVIRHGAPTSDRTRSQAVFNNVFLHIHSTRVHPHSLRFSYTWGLGVALASLFGILTVTGLLLMVYYVPSTDLAYTSIKDLHSVVPFGGLMRNMHRWGAHLMVALVILHMARVFYTASYKDKREFNWVVGVALFVLTLALSFTGYLLPWDQLAYWAVTIGANIAGSPDELTHALGLPAAFNVGELQKEILLGASTVGQQALTRFYLLHVVVLPLLVTALVALHIWRIRKDGGLTRPEAANTAAPEPAQPESAPTKTFGLMCVVKDSAPHVGKDPDETVPSWPYLLRAELLVFMATLLACLALGHFFDAPLAEYANPDMPENPAKAPWYFLGLQEMVSYSAFLGGIALPGLIVVVLALVPFLDREKEPSGVWFSGGKGLAVTIVSLIYGAAAAVASVAVPVRYGWLRDWYPEIPQLAIIACNPGSLLAVVYGIWCFVVMRVTRSTRMGAIALLTCTLVGFAILTYVGTYLRGPNWAFYWSQADWPLH